MEEHSLKAALKATGAVKGALRADIKGQGWTEPESDYSPILHRKFPFYVPLITRHFLSFNHTELTALVCL